MHCSGRRTVTVNVKYTGAPSLEMGGPQVETGSSYVSAATEGSCGQRRTHQACPELFSGAGPPSAGYSACPRVKSALRPWQRGVASTARGPSSGKSARSWQAPLASGGSLALDVLNGGGAGRCPSHGWQWWLVGAWRSMNCRQRPKLTFVKPVDKLTDEESAFNYWFGLLAAVVLHFPPVSGA